MVIYVTFGDHYFRYEIHVCHLNHTHYLELFSVKFQFDSMFHEYPNSEKHPARVDLKSLSYPLMCAQTHTLRTEFKCVIIISGNVKKELGHYHRKHGI